MDSTKPTVKCSFDKMVKVKDLKSHPQNRNKHPSDQIERLAKILEYQGFRYPIKVSKLSGFITSGHGRVQAAKKLGWKEVPVNYQDYEDLTQEYADVQADNAIASWSELDLSEINNDLGELGPDFDIDLLGIKNFTIDVAEKEALTDEDEVPSVKHPISEKGDVWILGDHRLMCGDSTVITDVEKLMNGEKACITFTSPPYNLGENAKLRGYNGDGDESAYISKSDHKSQEDYLQFLKDFTSLAIQNSKTVFVNIQMLAGNKLIMSEYWNFYKNNLIDLMIWNKEHAAPQMAARVLNSVFEFIFIFSHEEFPSRSIKTGRDFRGTEKNIFTLNPMKGGKDEFQKDHGAVFPVAFAEHFIDKFSDDSVIDFFGGSGTTMIAAEKLNRKSFLMEFEPLYVDVIIKRWQNYTGKQAKLESTGQTYEELKAVRNG